MELPYPKPRSADAKTHILKECRLNGECFGKAGNPLTYPQVTTLSISNCSFDDGQMNILRYYPSLVSLKIFSSSRIDNFEAVAACPRLKNLVVELTQIDSFHGIEFCQELEIIKLYDTRLNNMDVLDGMGLKKLQIEEDFSADEIVGRILDALPQNLPQLKYLGYRACVSLERIPSYPQLTDLWLGGESIKEIGHQPNLVNVSVANTSIRDLEFLRGSPVQNVVCRQSYLRSLEPLRDSGVKRLICNDNQLIRLPRMPALVNLDCSNNRILTLEDLSASSRLSDLNCSGNRLLNLRGIEKIRRLQKLNASNNDIFDISAIRNSPSLSSLDLRQNMIMHLPDCTFFSTGNHGRYLFDKNLIEDITHLPDIFKIRVNLTDNPLNPDSLGRISKGYRGFTMARY